MSRRVPINQLVYDQLSVFEEDGITKRSGLLSSNFTYIVYLNNVLQSPFTVNIVEILTSGEYSIQFTPTSIGFWLVEITSAFNDGVFRGEYDAVDPVTASSLALPGQIFHGVVRDTLGNGVAHVDVGVYAASTANLLYSTVSAFDGSYEIPLTGQLNQNILVDLKFSGGGIQAFTTESVRII